MSHAALSVCLWFRSSSGRHPCMPGLQAAAAAPGCDKKLQQTHTTVTACCSSAVLFKTSTKAVLLLSAPAGCTWRKPKWRQTATAG